MGMPTLSSPRVGCATSSQAGAVRPGRPDPTAACLRSRAPGEGSSPSPTPSSEALSSHAKEQPATGSAGREQLREWLMSGWEPHPDVPWRWRHQEGPRPPRETRAGGSAATPSHMRTRPRRQLAARPARARHVAPGLGRWLITLAKAHDTATCASLHRASAQGRSTDRRTASPPGPLGPPRTHAFKRTGMPLQIR